MVWMQKFTYQRQPSPVKACHRILQTCTLVVHVAVHGPLDAPFLDENMLHLVLDDADRAGSSMPAKFMAP